ncbi:MAG: phospholipid carrier-dependent glycosyltransferase [Spirulina sp. SIO3F2]|nr:phospholipid carrier-dependent glycosyltransferase [Spirulina sp. SIO3F2]
MATLRSPHSFPWFRWLLGLVFCVALALRLWRIGQINTLVFDEIYYAVFANRYLLGEFVYNSHPPLSQYLIAIGIWLGSHLPIDSALVNGLTGSLRPTFSYRWFNAIAGAWIPVIVGLMGFHWGQSRVFGAIAALVALLDGFFLVESRYGLNNIYLVLFGLLGHLCVLLALSHPSPPQRIRRQVRWRRRYLERPDRWLRQLSDIVSNRLRYPPRWQRWQLLTLAGICLGASVSVKWNGLGFSLALCGLWLGLQWQPPRDSRSPWFALARLPAIAILGYFVLLPLLIYCLLWIPHLFLNPEFNFWQLHRAMLTFHDAVGSGTDVHPYCSPWYSWPLMGRPVAYFYSTALNLRSLAPAVPPLPQGWAEVIYAVHAMGNPLLWWLSTGAIALMLGSRLLLPTAPDANIWLYCLWGYGANLVPWALVSRCTFLYHYMSALIFAQLALAYWLWQVWEQKGVYRAIAVLMLGLGGLAFWFWLPIYLGLPLSPAGYQLRMWFDYWI